MAIRLELHEDDEREMFRIRRELVGWHHVTPGFTQENMAKTLGKSTKFIHKLETGRVHYHLSSLQIWAGLFDLRVEPKIWFEMQVGDSPPSRTVPQGLLDEKAALWTMSRPFEAHSWSRLHAVSSLVVARYRLGVKTELLGKRLGIGASAVSGWERTSHDPFVSKLFTYARALGGRMVFNLVERRDWKP